MAKSTSNVPDEFAVLSAIWIMASNDENPIITYEGIKDRIGLPKDYDVKALTRKHGELFRPRVPKTRLDEWKDEMRSGNHMAGWIRVIEDRDARIHAIDGLTTEDVFRSQFRSEKKAPKSQVEVIDWGLQHIERLRKASQENKEQFAKRRDVWIAIGLGVANILISIAKIIWK